MGQAERILAGSMLEVGSMFVVGSMFMVGSTFEVGLMFGVTSQLARLRCALGNDGAIGEDTMMTDAKVGAAVRKESCGVLQA